MPSLPRSELDCNVRPIGAIIDELLIRFAETALFPPAATDAERKSEIMAARQRGDITDRQAGLLMEAFGLRSA